MHTYVDVICIRITMISNAHVCPIKAILTRNFNNNTYSLLSMTPDEFYTLFSQLPKDVVVPKTLVKYTKALYKHHKLPLDKVKGTTTTTEIPVSSKPNKKTAVLAFSGGLDSTATLLWAQKHGYNVTPVFVDMLNPSISHREKKAVMSICRKLGVKPLIIQHSIEMRRETSYKSHNLDENPAKNQYIWMRLIPIAQNLNAGTIFFGDTERPVEEEKYFSDTDKSYVLFGEHSTNLVKHPPVFKNKEDAMKLLFSHDPQLFYKTSSCYSRSMYFNSNRKRSGAPKNMCGLCFKCKRLMELLEKTPGALPLRRKRSVAPTSQK